MGQRITLQNAGTSIGYISYQNLSDLELVAQAPINPGQTITIWCVTNTLNIFRLPNSNIVTVSTEVFPNDNPIPANPQKRTEMVVGTISGSTTYQTYVFNYDTGTFSSPVDTGIAFSAYSINLIESKVGYMVVFSTLGYVSVRIYDYLGNEIGSYDGGTDGSHSNYSISNKFLVFIDNSSGTLIYSDGVTVNTTLFNPIDEFFIDTDYYNSISNKFLIYSADTNYSSYQLVDMNGFTPLMNYDNRFYQVYMPMYEVSNFIPAFVYNTGGTYSFFNIYDSNGKTLQQVDLTNLGTGYTNYDISYFGSNKMSVIFYTSGDTAVPYQIYVYDGDTNLLTKTSHERGDNYREWDTYYYDSFCGYDNAVYEDFHIVFYDFDFGENGFFITVDFCDIVSYFNVNQEFSTYVFANNANYDYYITIYNGLTVNDSLQALVSEDSGRLSLLTITSSGDSVSDVCLLSSLSSNYFYSTTYGSDTNIFIVQVSGGYIAYAYDMEGNQLDARPLVNNFDNVSILNTYYLRDDYNGWYFSSFSTINTSRVSCQQQRWWRWSSCIPD
jgi:hypothetical protein